MVREVAWSRALPSALAISESGTWQPERRSDRPSMKRRRLSDEEEERQEQRVRAASAKNRRKWFPVANASRQQAAVIFVRLTKAVRKVIYKKKEFTRSDLNSDKMTPCIRNLL